MDKTKLENQKLNSEFTLNGISPQNYISFIKFLDGSNRDDEVVTSLKKLSSIKKENLLMIEKENVRTLARLCNKHGCRLGSNKSDDNDSLKLFEFGRLLMDSQGDMLDLEFQSIKNAIRSNLASYSFINKDKTASTKLIAGLLQENNGLSNEMKALLYQNLAAISIRQKLYEKTIKYSKKALVLLEAEVFGQIKNLNDHPILRKDEVFKQKLMITLNGYLTISMGFKQIKNDPAQEQNFLQNYDPSLRNKPFLQNGLKLARSFLGKLDPFTLKFQKEIEKESQVENKKMNQLVDQKLNPLEDQKVSQVVDQKIIQTPNKADRPAGATIPRNRPDWLQEGRFLKRNHSNPRLMGSKPKHDMMNESLKSNQSDSKLKDRLAYLLKNNLKDESSPKEPGDTKNSTFSSGSGWGSREFRIKRNSASGLKPLKHAIHMREEHAESSEEPPSRNNESVITNPIETEESKSGSSSKGERSSGSRFQRPYSKGHVNLNQDKLQMDELAQSQLQIAKNLESIMRQQIEFEEKIARKIEETMWQTQKSGSFNDNLAQKELELQIELLKKDNEKVQQAKLEKELELEQLRSQFHSNNINIPKSMHASGLSTSFSSPGYMPFYNNQFGGPISPISLMGFNGQGSPLPQVFFANGSPSQSLDLRSSDSPQLNQNPIPNPNPIPNQTRVPQLQVPNRKKYKHQSSIEANMAENEESKQPQVKNVKDEIPMIIIEPPNTKENVNSVKDVIHEQEINPGFKEVIRSKAEDQKIPKIMIYGANSVAEVEEGKQEDVPQNEADPINLEEHPVPITLYSEKANSVQSESKSNLSSVNSSAYKSSVRSGKYSDPRNREFQLDFSKIGKKTSDQEEKRRPFEDKPKPLEDKLPIEKDRKLQLQKNAAITLPKTNVPVLNPGPTKSDNPLSKKDSLAHKSDNITVLTIIEVKDSSPVIMTLPQESETQNKQKNPTLLIPTHNDLKPEQISFTSSLYSISKFSSNDISKDGDQLEVIRRSENIIPGTTIHSLSSSNITPSHSNIEPSEIKEEPHDFLLQVQPLPTPKQEEPKLSWLLETANYIKFPKKCSIRKYIVLLEDPNTYQIDCEIEYNGAEPSLKVELKQKALTCDDYYSLSEESLKLSKLKKILENVEYKDILPSYLTIRSIKTFENFIKYIVFPFFGFSEDEEGYKKLEIWPKAPSLARTTPEFTFLNQKCLLSIYHISMTNFRITLMHTETEETLRIDLSLDESSFKHHFEFLKPMKALANPIETLASIIEIIEDEDSSASELQKAKKQMKELQNQSNIEAEFESCKFKDKDNEKIILEYAKRVLDEIEEFLSDKGFADFSKLCDMATQFKYFKVRVVNEFKRSSFSMLQENLEANGIDVYMKNFYETHAPNKKKIKAEGKYQYPLENVWKDFALNYHRMDQDDKASVYSLISELSALETHEKPLDPDDYETFEENRIIRNPIETSIFSRTFEGVKYKYPVTSVLVGVKGTPFGVRTSIYDAERCTEKGAFFYFNPSLWKRKEDETENKKTKKKWIIASPMIEKYHFDGLMQQAGYHLIRRQLIFDENPHKVELLGVESLRVTARSDLLENIVNVENFIKYYKDTRGSDSLNK